MMYLKARSISLMYMYFSFLKRDDRVKKMMYIKARSISLMYMHFSFFKRNDRVRTMMYRKAPLSTEGDS